MWLALTSSWKKLFIVKSKPAKNIGKLIEY